MKLPKRGRLLIVKWRDSAGESSWTLHPERHTLSVCTTVGYLAYVSKKRVVVAASHDGMGAWGERIAIPRPNLTDVRKLKVGKRP